MSCCASGPTIRSARSGCARSEERTVRPKLALAVTLGAQLLVTIALTTPSVLAPVVAPMFGLPSGRVGLFVGLCYLCAMTSGLAAGDRIAAIGPVRVSQWAIAGAGLGLILTTLGSLWLLVPAAIVIGAAYGLTNPAAAIVLGEHAPMDRRGLFFSIKQTAVPLGIALTGLLAPALLSLFGWRAAVLMLGALCIGGAAALGISRAVFDRPSRPAAASPPRNPLRLLLDPLRSAMSDPALRRLGLVSFAYALTQVCFLTFLVSFLNVEHGFTLALAAATLALAQITSVFSRVALGYVADRWIAPAKLLPLLGLAMAAACTVLGLLPAAPSMMLTVSVAMLCALTAVGWNGVFFAELARVAAPGRLASATGTTQFMTFCGGMTGPIVFSEAIARGVSYSASYRGMALVPLIAATIVWLATIRQSRAGNAGAG